jgi:hypothetical protein
MSMLLIRQILGLKLPELNDDPREWPRFIAIYNCKLNGD